MPFSSFFKLDISFICISNAIPFPSFLSDSPLYPPPPPARPPLHLLTVLNAWDKIEESGKRSESLTKIIQGLKEAFNNFFLQRMTSAINRIVSDSEVKQVLIKSLAIENANSGPGSGGAHL